MNTAFPGKLLNAGAIEFTELDDLWSRAKRFNPRLKSIHKLFPEDCARIVQLAPDTYGLQWHSSYVLRVVKAFDSDCTNWIYNLPNARTSEALRDFVNLHGPLRVAIVNGNWEASYIDGTPITKESLVNLCVSSSGFLV